MPEEKLGAGHMRAFLRQGVHELRNAMYTGSNVAQHYPETGLYGTATPQQVMNEREADSREVEREPEPESPSIDERIEQQEVEAPAPERETPEMERE